MMGMWPMTIWAKPGVLGRAHIRGEAFTARVYRFAVSTTHLFAGAADLRAHGILDFHENGRRVGEVAQAALQGCRVGIR